MKTARTGIWIAATFLVGCVPAQTIVLEAQIDPGAWSLVRRHVEQRLDSAGFASVIPYKVESGKEFAWHQSGEHSRLTVTISYRRDKEKLKLSFSERTSNHSMSDTARRTFEPLARQLAAALGDVQIEIKDYGT